MRCSDCSLLATPSQPSCRRRQRLGSRAANSRAARASCRAVTARSRSRWARRYQLDCQRAELECPAQQPQLCCLRWPGQHRAGPCRRGHSCRGRAVGQEQCLGDCPRPGSQLCDLTAVPQVSCIPMVEVSLSMAERTHSMLPRLCSLTTSVCSLYGCCLRAENAQYGLARCKYATPGRSCCPATPLPPTKSLLGAWRRCYPSHTAGATQPTTASPPEAQSPAADAGGRRAGAPQWGARAARASNSIGAAGPPSASAHTAAVPTGGSLWPRSRPFNGP